METKSRLYRSECLNMFYFNGMCIRNIIFYKEGKIVATTDWFGSSNNYKEVFLPFEIKKANKENLGRKDAYLLKAVRGYWGSEYSLYICCDLVELQFVETKTWSVGWFSTMTADVYQIKLEGGRYVYSKNERGDLIKTPNYGEHLETFETNHVSEYTEEYKKCEELAELLNSASFTKVSAHDIHEMLKVVDIKKKG